jgi:hypothetical protein
MDWGSRQMVFSNNSIKLEGVGTKDYIRCGIYLVPKGGDSKIPFGEISDNHIESQTSSGIIARDKYRYLIKLNQNKVVTTGLKYKGGEKEDNKQRLDYFSSIEE